MANEIPIIFATPAMKLADINSYQQIPQQSIAGLSIMKEPTGAPWIELTKYPGLDGVGYLAVENDAATITKFRIPLFNHPDGG